MSDYKYSVSPSVVRSNLLDREGYTPYCGDDECRPRTALDSRRWPRTFFNGEQFECPKFHWTSDFEKKFIDKYKSKWNK